MHLKLVQCIFQAPVGCEQLKEDTTIEIFSAIYLCQIVLLLHRLLFSLINIRYETLFWVSFSKKKWSGGKASTCLHGSTPSSSTSNLSQKSALCGADNSFQNRISNKAAIAGIQCD
jgi:hypothetical protein